MANYQNLDAFMKSVVYENDENAISGQGLQNVLDVFIKVLGFGYQFGGIATLEGEAPETDAKVFYLATQPGTYEGYGDVVLTEGKLGVITYGEEWAIYELPMLSEVNTEQIVDAAVTAAKIASNAVTTDKINGGAVTTPKIADEAVTKDKVNIDVAKTADVFLLHDVVLSSGSKAMHGGGDVVIFSVTAKEGDRLRINLSGRDTIWRNYNLYPILNGSQGSGKTYSDSSLLYTVPEGGITGIKIGIGGSAFIADGTIEYSLAINGESALLRLDGRDIDNLAFRKSEVFREGSVIYPGGGDWFRVDDAPFKKGDKLHIEITGMGTVISKYRLYINGTATIYDSADWYFEATADVTAIRMNVPSDGVIGSGTITFKVTALGVYDMFAPKNDILTRNDDLDDIIYAAKWTNDNSDKSQTELFNILVAGDIHQDETRFRSMIEYLNAKNFIDMGIMLGDLISGNYATGNFSFYPAALKGVNKPFITIVGNHDVGSSTHPADNAPSMEAVYNRYYAPTIEYAGTISHPTGKCYFYKDIAAYKTRLIMLNQFDYPDADLAVEGYVKYLTMYSQTQIDWFIDALTSTPSDYGVILAVHMAPDRQVAEDCPFTSLHFRGHPNFGSGNTTIDGDIIGDIINAWQNGSSLQHTYDITETSALSSLSVDVDFSSRGAGEFICYIGGHFHESIVSHNYAYSSQLMYSVNNAGMVARESDMPRKEGTKSEDCFVILSVDRARKDVKLVSVGARIANDMTHRETFITKYEPTE